MNLTSIGIFGRVLLLIAVFPALTPIIIAGRGLHPSTQIYQDAKGSWMPAGFAYSNPCAGLI
jgi:hypothetical protein